MNQEQLRVKMLACAAELSDLREAVNDELLNVALVQERIATVLDKLGLTDKLEAAQAEAKHTQELVDTAKAELDEAMEGLFRLAGQKKPFPMVGEVKEMTEYAYDADKAMAYCIEHNIIGALKLNVSHFQSKTIPDHKPDFVTTTKTPKAHVSTKLPAMPILYEMANEEADRLGLCVMCLHPKHDKICMFDLGGDLPCGCAYGLKEQPEFDEQPGDYEPEPAEMVWGESLDADEGRTGEDIPL